MDDYVLQALNAFWEGASRKARSEPSLNDLTLTESQRSMVMMRSLGDALKTFGDDLQRRYSAEARHHNTLLPISRLPNDILVDIFTLVSDMDDWYMESNYSGGGEMIALARLLLVCHEWKGIVSNAPSLWAYISSNRPDRVNFEILARADQVPLHISLNHYARDCEELDRRVFQEVHRWKAVKLFNVPIETLNELEQQPAPLLEKLDVRRDNRLALGRVNLFCGSAGRLRHLALFNIRFPSESDLLSRLRTLHIEHHEEGGLSAQEVMHVLQSCPDLTRFKLDLPPEAHPGSIPLETSTIELLNSKTFL
ncbi:hypothetical protein FRB95_012964 [Tulasnella sp. JGI-2019a]|nr:hypothetical protein FRB95_012964 [Tulasnella sp. JGI-2019a]